METDAGPRSGRRRPRRARTVDDFVQSHADALAARPMTARTTRASISGVHVMTHARMRINGE
ncbi:hypothetical protein WI41_02715 [Burkholderia latens]|uniref:Uncharacterized protein n=1 Tax=Burkholderia latens TaxID=488446 RepID=A0AAP1G6X5_9BURK|nr:hypothetical protein WI41_02715 [Burkholderia latens]